MQSPRKSSTGLFLRTRELIARGAVPLAIDDAMRRRELKDTETSDTDNKERSH
jgi:hypothetical protein